MSTSTNEASNLIQPNADRLIEATVDDMQQAMAEGKLTSRQLVLFYLDRIARYDSDGPQLNAVIEVNPDAVFLAEASDLERQTQGQRGPLHGIPVLIKDNIDTGDHMHTTAGSVTLANHYAARDSFVAAQLRAAGAIILGKTNLTEWANFMTNGMPNGYSSRGGQTLNPYGPGEFDTGGSSAGSGAAIAANLAAIAVGTETSGSILSPASCNSLVGIKPTVGLVSRTGIIPIAHSQDTAGPMARTVKDAALLLNVLKGEDVRDAATWVGSRQAEDDYTSFLDADGLQGARIGYDKAYWEHMNDGQRAILEAAIEKLQEAGAEVFEVTIPTVEEVSGGYEVLIYEFKSALNAYLATCGPDVPVHSLRDVIDYNHKHHEKALKYGQTLLIESERTSGTLTDAKYLNARLRDLQLSQTEGIDKTMAEHRLDALLSPANFAAGIAAKAGYPSITVPGGYTAEEGTPFGVTFTGTAYSEGALIRLAYAFEQATKHRVAPNL
ncbi:MAG TPA: amidase [Bacilli bacterium]|nr:amidase [Bacilli bacterium]